MYVIWYGIMAKRYGQTVFIHVLCFASCKGNRQFGISLELREFLISSDVIFQILIIEDLTKLITRCCTFHVSIKHIEQSVMEQAVKGKWKSECTCIFLTKKKKKSIIFFHLQSAHFPRRSRQSCTNLSCVAVVLTFFVVSFTAVFPLTSIFFLVWILSWQDLSKPINETRMKKWTTRLFHRNNLVEI